MNRSRPASALASVAAFTLLALVAAGCASGTDSGASDAGADSDGAAPAARVDEDAPDAAMRDGLNLNSTADTAASGYAEEERALISHGNVQLRSDDVGEALFEVQKVVDELAGEISQNETATDDDGLVKRARVVARIPSARFAEAMVSLEGAATLIASSSNIDDVTTKVIDNRLRLEVQQRSIRRIALLLDRAESIRDIVNIEAQLSRRQADLGSLQRQQAYLADQTQMATITVSLERTKAKPEETKDDEAKGFFAGLDKGWTEFKQVAVSLSTAAGAALPFLVVLALLGWPAWALVRRSARRRPAPTEAAAGS
ncbi:MAG: DUF4349 domain-containing protein [Nocardioides sp.]